jgi:transcriptional regulator with XRE-family HTH domain
MLRGIFDCYYQDTLMLPIMSIGALIRDLRISRGLSQGKLAEQLRDSSGSASMAREDISRYERDKVIPGPTWLPHLAKVLDVPEAVLTEEARLSRVNRRAFLSLAALTAAHGKVAAETIAAVSGGDPVLLASGQTTHGTDLVIASMVDVAAARHLRRWMADADDAVLRVNAAGILAKLPDQSPAREVATVLSGDRSTRHLYTTAVLARACLLDWMAAERLAADPMTVPASKAAFIARRLANEVLNPRDAGARWCSATVLRDLSPILR